MDAARYWLRVERLCWATLVAIVANWLLSFVDMAWLGGDGWGGYVADGHYFVASHGRYTETSRIVFEYTRIHSAFSMAMLPIAIATGVAAALLREHRKKRKIIGTANAIRS